MQKKKKKIINVREKVSYKKKAPKNKFIRFFVFKYYRIVESDFIINFKSKYFKIIFNIFLKFIYSIVWGIFWLFFLRLTFTFYNILIGLSTYFIIEDIKYFILKTLHKENKDVKLFTFDMPKREK